MPAESSRSVSFTEQMKGFVQLGVTDYEQGRAEGRELDQRLMFELTISTGDVDRFVSEPAHEGSAVGYVESDVLGGRLDVERGWFNLFVSDAGPDRRRMLYRLFFRGGGGNPLTLVGFKDVHDDPGFDVWRDTSTLYVHILDGHVDPPDDDGATVLGAGIITIHLTDFMRQLTTFRATGDRKAASLEAFGRLFLGELWDVYGPAFVRAGGSG
jgi:cholesterol oxidase